MEALNIFKDPHTKIKDPYHSLAYSCTLTLSNLFFGFTLVYLSAIDFPVIAKIYSIEFDLYFAQGLFQGVLPIGGAVGALSSSYLVSKLSRKYFNNNPDTSYITSMQLPSYCLSSASFLTIDSSLWWGYSKGSRLELWLHSSRWSSGRLLHINWPASLVLFQICSLFWVSSGFTSLDFCLGCWQMTPLGHNTGDAYFCSQLSWWQLKPLSFISSTPTKLPSI